MVDERFEYVKLKLSEGISQRQIALELGVDHSTIAYWIKHGFTTGCKSNISTSEVIKLCNEYSAQYSYILGSYLGDGYIVKFPRTYKLRIYNDSRYDDIINDQLISLRSLFKKNKISTLKRTKSNCIEVSVHCNILPIMFPQHGSGKKHGRDVSLLDWQWDIVWKEPECFIKGLIDSDGSHFLHTQEVKGIARYRYIYQFTNKSLDIVDMYLKIMGKLDISARPTQKKCGVFNIFTNKSDDVKKIDKLYEIAETKLRAFSSIG